MIYPVGTRQVFKDKWYIASYFGEKRTSTWIHSGDDFNLKTGGNTDFNAPLYAVADGKILTTRYKDTGFGNTLTMEFVIEGKTYYALYAHLNGFNCKEGDLVKKGQQICRLGNSGRSATSHLHFSIKNTANGIDNIPNNAEELKQWENPLQFIQKHYFEGSSDPRKDKNNMIEVPKEDFEKLVTKADKYDKFVAMGYSNPDDIERLEIDKEACEMWKRDHVCDISDTTDKIKTGEKEYVYDSNGRLIREISYKV